MTEICKCGHDKHSHGWFNGEKNKGSCSFQWYKGKVKPRKICYCKCKKFEAVEGCGKCDINKPFACEDCKPQNNSPQFDGDTPEAFSSTAFSSGTNSQQGCSHPWYDARLDCKYCNPKTDTFNLSEKMFEIKGYFEGLFEEKDVREFIKRLKEEEIGCDRNNPLANHHANYCGHRGYLCDKCKSIKYFIGKIDKLAGDELVK